jgi:predicted RNase H-like HicB family nuclease
VKTTDCRWIRPQSSGCANLDHVSDSPNYFTIRYEDGGEGWVMATIREVPGAISQGRTRAEARENVIDALRLMLGPEPEPDASTDSELLPLSIG